MHLCFLVCAFFPGFLMVDWSAGWLVNERRGGGRGKMRERKVRVFAEMVLG